MKELSIEEKAKAYDEAIKRAQAKMEEAKVFDYDDEQTSHTIRLTTTDIFPELKESEDEKMIQYFKDLAPFDKADELYEKYGFSHKDAIAWLEKQGEQKPADKVEPKFHEGEWIIDNNIKTPFLITGISNEKYDVISIYGNDMAFSFREVEHFYHLWTIQDAKDGDVLSYVTDEGDLWIMIYQSLYEPYEGHVHYHALLVNDNFSDKGTCCICIDNLKPATEERRDLLFQKMKEAGYEWDAEKKELKKVEEEVNGEDYGIDSLYHAQIILEETLGSVDGYQSDDGILSHKAAITAVKKLYEQQKTAEWSEEDKNTLDFLVDYLLDTIKKMPAEEYAGGLGKAVVLLKSLKDKVQPQPMQQWSGVDEAHLHSLITHLEQWIESNPDTTGADIQGENIAWLKSLRPQLQWRPSEEQMNNK